MYISCRDVCPPWKKFKGGHFSLIIESAGTRNGQNADELVALVPPHHQIHVFSLEVLLPSVLVTLCVIKKKKGTRRNVKKEKSSVRRMYPFIHNRTLGAPLKPTYRPFPIPRNPNQGSHPSRCQLWLWYGGALCKPHARMPGRGLHPSLRMPVPLANMARPAQPWFFISA